MAVRGGLRARLVGIDEDAVRDILRDLLSELGVTVIDAPQEEVDVLLVLIGHEDVLERLATARTHAPSTPIIALTTFGGGEALPRQAHVAGAAAFYALDSSTRDLEHALTNVLKDRLALPGDTA